MPSWEIRGNELRLIDAEGNTRVPSTDEIYSALVERQPTESWIPIEVQDLKASRYPLMPVIKVSADTSGVPTYSLISSVRGMPLTLSIEDLRRGHTIIQNIWYPIDQDTGAEILKLMHENSISLGFATSLKGFLAIRRIAAMGGVAEDHIGNQVISPLAFMPVGEDVPVGINATLYPYQLAGWRWLKFLMTEGVGGLLADEMGLGKTLQIISALSDTKKEPARPVLGSRPIKRAVKSVGSSALV